MWQETTNNDLPEPSTVFGVGAIFYAALAFVAAASVASASSFGAAVSGVVLGFIFLTVAGISARMVRGSSDWPSMSQLTSTEPRALRTVPVEAKEEGTKAA